MLFVGFILYIFLAGFYYFAPSSAAGSGFVVLSPLVVIAIMYFVRSKTCPICKDTEWETSLSPDVKAGMKENREEWHCEHCKFICEAEAELIKHYTNNHPQNMSFKNRGAYYKIKSLSNEEKKNGQNFTKEESPLDILKKRFARGEISKEEFEQMKKVLE